MLDLPISKTTVVSFEFVEDIFNKLEENVSIKNTKRNLSRSKPIKILSVPYTAKNLIKDKLKRLIKIKPISLLI